MIWEKTFIFSIHLNEMISKSKQTWKENDLYSAKITISDML